MIDLQEGDEVVCDVGDGITRVGTIAKITPNQLHFVHVPCGDLPTDTVPFYKDELTKTYDIDQTIKELAAL